MIIDIYVIADNFGGYFYKNVGKSVRCVFNLIEAEKFKTKTEANRKKKELNAMIIGTALTLKVKKITIDVNKALKVFDTLSHM